MKKILCLTDFSGTAANATRYAAWLARETGSSLTLLHVVQHRPLQGMLNSRADMSGLNQKLREAEKKLMSCREEAMRFDPDYEPRHRHLSCDTLVGEGLLISVVEYYLLHDHYDLVVMGTLGQRENPLNELLIGSNALHMFEHATVPILSVPDTFQEPQLHRVVFATDFQPHDQEVLLEVIELVSAFEAQLHVLHVSKPGRAVAEEQQLVTFARPIACSTTYEHLHFSRIDHEEPGIGLFNYATDMEADLVVLVGKQHTTYRQLFRQSLLELATYHAALPLLVFPAAWEAAGNADHRHLAVNQHRP